MDAISGFAVTLSPPLLQQLRDESLTLDIPLEYLVAGLVLDAIEEGAVPEADELASF